MTGYTLDPDIAQFIAQLSAAWREHPPLESLSVEQARAVAEQVRVPWRAGGPVMAEQRDVTVDLPHGPMRIRLYRPDTVEAGAAPALLYLHGGGFVFFSIDSHDRLMREYAAAAGMVVIGVDYPLSPEHRYPLALEQIVALVRWLEANGGGLGVDPGRVAVGGDSAGANLSVATALVLRDAGEGRRLRAVLSNYGAFSGEVSDAAEAAYGGTAAILTREEMNYYFTRYLRSAEDAGDGYAAPLVAADLSGLPPVFLVIPEIDVLREQSEAMAARLRNAGVDVASKLYSGATHSFLEAMSIAEVAREAIADASRWLADRLARPDLIA